MRLLIPAVLLVGAFACGGSDTPAPKKAEPAPAPAAEKAEPAPEAAKTEAPKEEAKPADFATMKPEEQLAFLMKTGENVYKTGGNGGVACITCHQANGEGLKGTFPPLKGNKEGLGDCLHHAGLVVHGLSGQIEVEGVKYNGVMPPQPGLSDLEIASVITYERSSWGNDFGPCQPSDVASARTAPAPKG